jgi:phage repressor protein C with HTH and peptisase S24 domain
MEKEGIIERIEVLMKKEADNPNSFSKKVGIDPSGFRKKMKGDSPIMSRDLKKISDALGVDREWLETGDGEPYAYHDFVNRALIREKVKEAGHHVCGVPFYDVDFNLGFHEMYNDEPNIPSKYISVPGYEKADFWCRTSGDSMKPFINNGDIIALKEIPDWQSFLPMNEVYAIMTTNDLRTVKVVRRGSDDMHFTLHAYNDEYEDQEISKTAITKVYKLLGALKTL